MRSSYVFGFKAQPEAIRYSVRYRHRDDHYRGFGVESSFELVQEPQEQEAEPPPVEVEG